MTELALRSDRLSTPLRTFSTQIATLTGIFPARDSSEKRRQVSIVHYNLAAPSGIAFSLQRGHFRRRSFAPPFVLQAIRGPRYGVETFLLDWPTVHGAFPKRTVVNSGQGVAHLVQHGGIGFGLRELLGSHFVGETGLAEVMGGFKKF